MRWSYMQAKVESRIGTMKERHEIPYMAHINGKLDKGCLEYLAAYDVLVSENVPEDIMEYRTPGEREAILRDILSGASREMSRITRQSPDVVSFTILEINKLLEAYKDSLPKSD